MPKEAKANIGKTIPCPKCGHGRTGVFDSRHSPEPFGHIRRRRECPECKHRFTTREIEASLDDLYGFMAGDAEWVGQEGEDEPEDVVDI